MRLTTRGIPIVDLIFDRLSGLCKFGNQSGSPRATLCYSCALVDLTKAEIIQRGVQLGVDYGKTHSCYDPDPQGLACGTCDSCVLRRRGFEAAGVPDPTRYSV